MMKLSNDGSKVYFLNRSANNTYTNTNYEEVHEYNAQVPFSQIYQVGGHSGDVTNNDRGTSNQIISVRKGSIKGSGDEGTLGQSFDGAYGALTLHADGSYTYVANSDIDGLDENEVVYDQFNYTAQDASGDSDIGVITITINGVNSNTPPTVETAAVDPSIDEAVDASSQDLLASGTITFADDNDADLTISGAASSIVTTGTGVSIPSIAMQIALEGAISVTDNGDNTATWQLDASGLDLDFLNEGETITLEYAVTAEDDDGETVTDNVTVTITGTNDAPIAVDDTGNVEVGTEFSGNVLTSSMGGEDVELDAGDSFQVDRLTGFGTAQVISNTPGSSATAVGTYGTITLSEDGSVTYNADQAAAIALASGQPSVSETFNYRISDTAGETGTGTITFTISGVNDAPAVNDDNGTPDDASDDIANAATVSTVEDTPHTFGADDFNFTDIDTDDTLASVTITSLPDKGTLTLNGAEVTLDTPIVVADLGNLVYTPVDNENGDGYTSFAYTVSDGELDSPAATMTINVTPVNDAPVAADDTSSVLVGTEYAGNVLSAIMGGEDADPDAFDTLIVSALGDTAIADSLGASASVVGTYGTLVLGRDGSVTYNADQPAAAALNYGDDAVTDTFSYTVADGNGGTDIATVTFSVTAPNPGNTAPTAADSLVSINEDASITFVPEQFNYSDADGHGMDHLTIVALPNVGYLDLAGSPVSAGDQIPFGEIENLSFTPDRDANGEAHATFIFSVNDGELDSVSNYTMTIGVTAINDAPTASNNTVTLAEDATKTFVASEFNFVDSDGDSLSHITIATLPSSGTLTLSGAPVEAGDNIPADQIDNLVYMPAADGNGDEYDDFTFTVNDGTVDSASNYSMTIDVTPVNDAPQVIDKGGTPDDVSDDVANSSSITTQEDTDRIILAADLNFTDVDDGDSLEGMTITALPTNGTLFLNGTELTASNLGSLGVDITLAELNNNELVFRPAADENGDDYATFTYTVSDGEASSSEATMTINVAPENDGPVVAAIIDDKTEDDEVFSTNLLVGQSDPEGDDLSIVSPIISAEDGNGNALTLPDGAASVSGNELRVDPTLFDDLDDGESVVIAVSYDVSDGDLTEPNTATITITGVNDAPIISPLTNTNEKTDADYSFDLLQGAEDVDGDELSVSGTPEIVFTDKDGNEVDLPIGAAVIDGNSVEISPAVFNSLDTGEDVTIAINYNITDGDQIVANTATIVISGENTAPQIIDDNGTPEDMDDDQQGVASERTSEDTPLIFGADSFNFFDPDENDSLNHITIITLPEIGSLRLGNDFVQQGDVIPINQIGNLTFTPDANDNGENYASFRYSVSDGTESSEPGTMIIHVDDVNDVPTSENINLQLTGDDEILLSKDNFAFVDVDGDELATVTIVTAPTEGTLYLNNQPVQAGDVLPEDQLDSLTYQPGDNASGENYDAFTFRVGDGLADSDDSYTVNVGVNAAPQASDSDLDVAEGRPAPGTMSANDPDDIDLRYEITEQPEHGSLELINGGPDYIYTPDPYYHGPDSFRFTASDGSLTSDEAEVRIGIQPANNAPIERLRVPSQAIMLEGKVRPIKLADFFGDVDAFDPSKRNFQKSITNLFEKGSFPNGAKFANIPPAGT